MLFGFNLEFQGIKAQHKLMEAIMETAENRDTKIIESVAPENVEDISF